MSYLRCSTFWKVRRLCWNHEPCLMGFDGEHLAPATFRRHRHLRGSFKKFCTLRFLFKYEFILQNTFTGLQCNLHCACISTNRFLRVLTCSYIALFSSFRIFPPWSVVSTISLSASSMLRVTSTAILPIPPKYTGCPRTNVPYFERVFLLLKYTDVTNNTYVQS